MFPGIESNRNQFCKTVNSNFPKLKNEVDIELYRSGCTKIYHQTSEKIKKYRNEKDVEERKKLSREIVRTLAMFKRKCVDKYSMGYLYDDMEIRYKEATNHILAHPQVYFKINMPRTRWPVIIPSKGGVGAGRR